MLVHNQYMYYYIIQSDLSSFAGLQIRVCNTFFFNENICCVHSTEPSRLDGYIVHPQVMLKQMDKKKITIYAQKVCISETMVLHKKVPYHN